METEQKHTCEIGSIDDHGHETKIDEFPNSISAYGWCIQQEGHVYYRIVATGQRFAFKGGRLDIDLFR